MIGKLLLLLSIGYFAFTPLKNHLVEEDWKTIEGAWIPITAELGEQKLPDEYLKSTKMVFTAGRYTYRDDQGTYKLIPSTEPKTQKAMDFTGIEGPNKGRTLPAIYEVVGDTLKICMDLAGNSRPGGFKTRAGTQELLIVYKKAKQ